MPMSEYQINKGVGRQVEFQGLTAQYLFIFVGGMGAVFLLFVMLFMAGVPQGICIVISFLCAVLISWGTFYLNRRYGVHGLMKVIASRQYPRRIIHRRAIRRLLKTKF